VTLRVRSVFGIASIQDRGRPGYRRFGVPVGGAFDSESCAHANAALGNDSNAPVIEFALGTMELEVVQGGHLAVVGAAEAVSIGSARFDLPCTVEIGREDLVVVHPPRRGLRTYLACPGGFVATKTLGSVSSIAVDRGAMLQSYTEGHKAMRAIRPPESLIDRPLRVVTQDASWCETEYSVGRNIDRVGLRLEGPKPMLDARAGRSEPSVFGVVQLTEDRSLIVHGPDGPTIGGYRKLGCVIRADLDRLAQLAPADKVRFQQCSVDEARTIWEKERTRREEVLQ